MPPRHPTACRKSRGKNKKKRGGDCGKQLSRHQQQLVRVQFNHDVKRLIGMCCAGSAWKRVHVVCVSIHRQAPNPRPPKDMFAFTQCFYAALSQKRSIFRKRASTAAVQIHFKWRTAHQPATLLSTYFSFYSYLISQWVSLSAQNKLLGGLFFNA